MYIVKKIEKCKTLYTILYLLFQFKQIMVYLLVIVIYLIFLYSKFNPDILNDNASVNVIYIQNNNTIFSRNNTQSSLLLCTTDINKNKYISM
jgi:hypothetical protein